MLDTRFKPRHELIEIEPVIVILVVSNRLFAELLQGREPQDESGVLALKILRENGISKVSKLIIPNDKALTQRYVQYLHEKHNINTIITIGGTGPSHRDQTIDAIREIADKELPGFGELFRRLSERKLGPHIILTRASAFIYRRCVIFCLPGSPDAVEIALKEIILPTLKHVLSELYR